MRHLLALSFASIGIGGFVGHAQNPTPSTPPQCQPPICAWIVTWHYPPRADRTFTEGSLKAALAEADLLLSQNPQGEAAIHRTP